MDLHKRSSTCKRIESALCLSALAFLTLGPTHAVDLIEDFNGGELDLTIWERTGTKSHSIADGRLTFADDGPGNWQTGEITTNQIFLPPPSGETTTISWTIGPASISPSSGNNPAIRYQIGIISADETFPNKEHYNNSTGGLWLDIDALNDSSPDIGSGDAYSANDDKPASSQGTNEGGFSFAWNWLEESQVITLSLTDTEYSWFADDTLLISNTFESAGLNSELLNGYRVIALGMNFDSGRGTTSYERIEIQNATELSDTLETFDSNMDSTVSGQEITLTWRGSPQSSFTLDPEIGNVDSLTSNGEGSFSFIAPEVTARTTLTYTLTAVLGDETIRRIVEVDIFPPSFFEDFDEGFLDLEMWTKTGDQSFFFSDSRLNWVADGSDWSHGEVESNAIFPIPEGDGSTTITWVYGPSQVTVDNGDGSAIRPLMGIFSANEDETFSKQHWQNDEGGIWLDISRMGETRTDGVSGNIHIANDSKIRESTADEIIAVDIPWDWQNESQEFSLVLTSTGFTWFSGSTELGSGLYSEFGLDTEIEPGFGVMAMAGNSNAGRGRMSFESISLQTQAATPADQEIVITDIQYSSDEEALTLEWVSRANSTYSIERLDANGDWQLATDEVEATGTSTRFDLQNVFGRAGIFRVIEE